jgi:hypothetical protein
MPSQRVIDWYYLLLMIVGFGGVWLCVLASAIMVLSAVSFGSS